MTKITKVEREFIYLNYRVFLTYNIYCDDNFGADADGKRGIRKTWSDDVVIAVFKGELDVSKEIERWLMQEIFNEAKRYID